MTKRLLEESISAFSSVSRLRVGPSRASKTYDVAIVGAGPAGALAALVLARAGRRVVLIDARPGSEQGSPFRIGESLPPAGGRLLASLGLRALLDRGGHLPSRGNLIAWGSSELHAVDSIRDPEGAGWHLDRARFDLDLRAAAFAAGATWLPARFERLERVGGADAGVPRGWELTCSGAGGPARVRATLVLDASGRQALVARQAGALRTRDDDWTAVYSWHRPARGDRDTRTLVEACALGWWYTSLLPCGARVAALHADAATAREILRSRERWKQALSETVHLRRLVDPARALRDPARARLGPTRGAEASGARLDRFSGAGWIAAGDAALSFDPLSSQGIFNALYTGMKAAEALLAALSMEDSSQLDAYDRRLEEIRAIYMRRRQLIYAQETRFDWVGRIA